MRVMIATVSAGGGHVAAAKALQEAWSALRPKDQVQCLDVLEFTSPVYRRIHHKTYLQVVEHVPELYALMFKRTDNPAWVQRATRLRRSFARHANQPFVAKLRAYKPEVIVSTHYLPLEVAGGLKAREPEFAPFVACVITDFEAHALWMESVVDLYCVAADETRASLIARGARPEQVAVTGIPIASKFSTPQDPGAIRRKLGVRDDLPVVLALGGGLGMGPLEEILQELDKIEKPHQAIVITGRNQELRRELACRDYRHPTRILGFSDAMQEWMSIASIIITKPGGLTSSEALAVGRPLLIVNPIPGQETANSDYLLEHGAAVKVNRTQDIAPRLTRILGTEHGAVLAEKARALGRPRAARDACEAILRACQTPDRKAT